MNNPTPAATSAEVAKNFQTDELENRLEHQVWGYPEHVEHAEPTAVSA